MYGYVSEEKVVKAIALLGVLAMIGVTVTPLVVGDIVGGLYIAGAVNDRGATAAGLVAGG